MRLDIDVVRLTKSDVFRLSETNLNEEASCFSKIEDELNVSQIGLAIWFHALKIA